MSIASTLSINPIYLVIFEKTGQPYITEDGNVYVFLKESDAHEFMQNSPGTAIKGPEYRTSEELCSDCYGAGALKIVIKIPGKNQERTEDLTRIKKKKYYNFELNHELNLLHETKKKKYLYGLADKKYIVPIKINTGSDVVIEYSIAKMKENRYFLAFSSLDEYNVWAEKVEGYNPIEITYDEMVELCGSDDCIINIFGARYILTQEKIRMIRQG